MFARLYNTESEDSLPNVYNSFPDEFKIYYIY